VLAVMPHEEDIGTLGMMLPSPKWSLHKSRTLTAATKQLRGHRLIGVVSCERDLLPGSWKEMLDYIRRVDPPPLLIVASRFADEQLWAPEPGSLRCACRAVRCDRSDPHSQFGLVALAESESQREHPISGCKRNVNAAYWRAITAPAHGGAGTSRQRKVAVRLGLLIVLVDEVLELGRNPHAA